MYDARAYGPERTLQSSRLYLATMRHCSGVVRCVSLHTCRGISLALSIFPISHLSCMTERQSALDGLDADADLARLSFVNWLLLLCWARSLLLYRQHTFLSARG